MSNFRSKRIAAAPNVHARRFDNEVVILDLTQGLYFGLDEVGAEMWDRFLLGQSPHEIALALAERYSTSEEQLANDACTLLKALCDANLVVPLAEDAR